MPTRSCQTQFHRSRHCSLVKRHCVPPTVCSCPFPTWVLPLSPRCPPYLCSDLLSPLPFPCSLYSLTCTSKLQLLTVASDLQHIVGTASALIYSKSVFLQIWQHILKSSEVPSVLWTPAKHLCLLQWSKATEEEARLVGTVTLPGGLS